MMKKVLIVFLFSLSFHFLFAQCKDGSINGGNYVGTWTGTIAYGKKPAPLSLTINSAKCDSLFGSSMVNGKNLTQFSGLVYASTAGTMFELREPNDNKHSGIFALSEASNNELTGTWKSYDGKFDMPVVLKRK